MMKASTSREKVVMSAARRSITALVSAVTASALLLSSFRMASSSEFIWFMTDSNAWPLASMAASSGLVVCAAGGAGGVVWAKAGAAMARAAAAASGVRRRM